jgi:hypothetical protein
MPITAEPVTANDTAFASWLRLNFFTVIPPNQIHDGILKKSLAIMLQTTARIYYEKYLELLQITRRYKRVVRSMPDEIKSLARSL